MPTATPKSRTVRTVSVLKMRNNLGKMLEDVAERRGSLVIEKRGSPRAVLMSVSDYVRLAAPEPDVLRVIGVESERNGTDRLASSQIESAIKAARAARRKR